MGAARAESATGTVPTARGRAAATLPEGAPTRNSFDRGSPRSGLPCGNSQFSSRQSDSRVVPIPHEWFAGTLRSPPVARPMLGSDPIADGAYSRAFRRSRRLEPEDLLATMRRGRASPSTSDVMSTVALGSPKRRLVCGGITTRFRRATGSTAVLRGESPKSTPRRRRSARLRAEAGPRQARSRGLR